MSLRSSEMVKRWKERHRSHSGTSTLADHPGPVSRPTTATAVDSWTDYNNNALPKVVEAAVLAAFSSGAFQDALTSMIEPALSKQQDKLNQLKLAHLNLESTVQARLDELPLLLQPAISHMTSLKLPSYEKELEKLAAGQEGLLRTFDERMENVENQLQGLDGRLKALEDKVVNADLRSALRFGELSNELQDRNTTLTDRLWELEREVGGKLDGQQRKIVSLGEDWNKGIRRIQDKISDLDSAQSGEHDGNSPSNSELLEKMEKMSKSLSKLDSIESSLRRDIHAVSSKVSSLDTSSLESYPRKLEAIERTISNLKSEIETQGTLASLDSKLLSTSNARLEALGSNVTKLGYVLESVKNEIFDGEVAQSHAKKLASVDSKVIEMLASIGAVQNHVSSLDTSALPAHSTHLGDLASGLARLEDHLKLVDTTPLSSHSDTLADIRTTISHMQTNIQENFSSQDEGFAAIKERMALLPESAKLDSILSNMEHANLTASNGHESLATSVAKILDIAAGTQDVLSSHSTMLENASMATSNGHESLSVSLSKILDITTLTQDALSSQSTMLETTSQTLTKLHTETHDALKPLSSHLNNISSRIGSENNTLLSIDQNLSGLAIKLDSQATDLAKIKGSTGISEIIAALNIAESSRESALSTLNEALQEIQKSAQEMHSSTMSEIRHKDASILAEIQKVNTSHVEQATWFSEAKSCNAAHAKALEAGFANLGALGKESQTQLDSISSGLESTRQSHSEHHNMLNEILDLNRSHSKHMSEVNTNSTQLLESHEKSLTLAETHASAIGNLHELASKKEDVEVLRSHLGDVLNMLKSHSTTLEAINQKDSISTLAKQMGESRELITARADTVQVELATLKTLLEANRSLGKEILADNAKGHETVTKVLEEMGSSRSLMEKHSVTAATEAAALSEGMQVLKSMVEQANMSSKCDVITEGISEVKGLVLDVKEHANATDVGLQPSIKSIITSGEKTSTSLNTVLSLLASVKEESTYPALLESVASLRSVVESQESRSLSPEILQMTKVIEDKVSTHGQSIVDLQSSIQIVKEDATAALILTEIGTLKESAASNASSLKTIHDSITTVGEKVKDSDGAISKSIQAVQSSISEEGSSRHAENESLVSDIKRLGTSLDASTSTLQADVKAVDSLARANEKANEASRAKLSIIETVVSSTSTDVTGLLHEHLPKLSQDVQAINLKKLNTAATSTEKALTSITASLDELSQLAKGNDTKVLALDGKVSQASEVTSYEIIKVQNALQALDTALTETTQETTKARTLIESQSTSLETIKSDLLSINKSTTSALSTITSELSTIAPAVRINSAAISRVDRAVLETGAQVKSVVLDGNSKLSKELDSLLEQLDESLHDSGTRIMGISDFDLPRLQEMVKSLEGVLERGLGGNLKANRRTRDALSVIGARVVGTQKKFDEMVEAHGEWEEGGKSLEGSGVLSVREGGRPEHRRLGSRSFRALSNASSGKDAGGSLRGKVPRGESSYT